MKLRRIWFLAELFGALNIAKQYKRNTEEWMRIQTATVWLKGVRIARSLAICQMAIVVAATVLVLSVLLMECALILCIPASAQAKAIIGLIVAILHVAIAAGCIVYFLSSTYWLKQAAKHNACLAQITGTDKVL